MTYDFNERLNFSVGARNGTDSETIMSLLDGCSSVRKNDVPGNDKGVDYIATLRGGAEVNIDVKTREAGCSKYWNRATKEPELAIEKWSVMPGGEYETPHERSSAGWTIDESKVTDMILYTFDERDSQIAFLLPFQSLRIASRRMISHWMKRFKVDVQKSRRNGRMWQSQAVFVPASEVIAAMETTFSAQIAMPPEDIDTYLF